MNKQIRLISHYQKLIDLRDTLAGNIGLVPTMGNLHVGHLSLVKSSLEENDYTIVSIYVNPKQFGPNEDFENYPRTLEEDVEKISSVCPQSLEKLIIFHPQTLEQMFGPHKDELLKIPLKGLDQVLCAKNRPGHFAGVVTVVKHLFDLTRPTHGYFGKKDFQQILIVEQIVKHFALPITIKRVPTSRNSEGLALSCRNYYISSYPDAEKLYLRNSLKKISQQIENKKPFAEIEEMRKTILSEKPGWDYLDILDAKNLKDISPKTESILIAGAFVLGKSRLIDNLVVDYK